MRAVGRRRPPTATGSRVRGTESLRGTDQGEKAPPKRGQEPSENEALDDRPDPNPDPKISDRDDRAARARGVLLCRHANVKAPSSASPAANCSSRHWALFSGRTFIRPAAPCYSSRFRPCAWGCSATAGWDCCRAAPHCCASACRWGLKASSGRQRVAARRHDLGRNAQAHAWRHSRRRCLQSVLAAPVSFERSGHNVQGSGSASPERSDQRVMGFRLSAALRPE